MKRHLIVVAVILMVSLAFGQAFAESASTPVYLNIEASEYYVPSTSGGGSKPDTTDYTYFTEEEKENYQKLSPAGKKTVVEAKSITGTITSANSKLHNKKAVVVSWKYSKPFKWDGTEIFRSKKQDTFKFKKPFFEVKNKRWYKNNKLLKYDRKYYYRVRSYIIVEGYRFYSRTSPVTGNLIQPKAKFTAKESKSFKKLNKENRAFVTKIKKATTKLTVSPTANSTVLSWQMYDAHRAQPVNAKFGAEIYRAKKSSAKSFTKIATIEGRTSYAFRNLSTQYSYRVRLYVTVGGNRYYSQYSDISAINGK